VVEQEVDAVLLGLDRVVERAGADHGEPADAQLEPARRARVGPDLALDHERRLERQLAERVPRLGATAFLTTTPWTTPEPSRTTTNATFPDDRTCVTHPRRVTTWPT
jgi:hypothetical protein